MKSCYEPKQTFSSTFKRFLTIEKRHEHALHIYILCCLISLGKKLFCCVSFRLRDQRLIHVGSQTRQRRRKLKCWTVMVPLISLQHKLKDYLGIKQVIVYVRQWVPISCTYKCFKGIKLPVVAVNWLLPSGSPLHISRRPGFDSHWACNFPSPCFQNMNNTAWDYSGKQPSERLNPKRTSVRHRIF